ncbi:MAG TPA: adenylate/guanylate cyclase domain-containing protein [Stellaceae bacterium]|nr:adenylate/guanylate cyclase domain-containing protein [Stellaceae bacterium]
MRALKTTTNAERGPALHPVPRLCDDPRAILVIDFAAFSRLPDASIPIFHECVMRPVAEVMAEHEDGRLYDNSWGDAIIAVFEDASRAAHFSLDLQDRLACMPFAALGLPATLRPRIAGDYGRTWQGYDFVRKELTFYGVHVTRAARLEPVTPPGAVYVTESFAEAASADRALACRYVGEIATAKNFGVLGAFELTRAPEASWTAPRS